MHLSPFVSFITRKTIAALGALALLVGFLIPLGSLSPAAAQSGVATGTTYTFVAMAPCHLATMKLRAKRKVDRRVAGACGVPANASAVVLGLEATRATRTSRVVVWPAGTKRPRSATLAWQRPARTDTGHATVQLADRKAISLWNQRGRVRVSVDVQGYYAPVAPAVRTTTLAVEPSQMLLFGSDASPGTTNGCATNSASTAASGRLSLTLPVGARLRSIETSVYDGWTADPYEVKLMRFVSRSNVLDWAESIPLASGGADTIVVKKSVTQLDHVVASDETFAIHMSNLKSFNNGLCQVFVTYEVVA